MIECVSASARQYDSQTVKLRAHNSNAITLLHYYSITLLSLCDYYNNRMFYLYNIRDIRAARSIRKSARDRRHLHGGTRRYFRSPSAATHVRHRWRGLMCTVTLGFHRGKIWG